MPNGAWHALSKICCVVTVLKRKITGIGVQVHENKTDLIPKLIVASDFPRNVLLINQINQFGIFQSAPTR